MPELTMEQMTKVMTARQAELAEGMDKAEREYREAIEPMRVEHERLSTALNALNGTAPVRRGRRPSSSASQRPRGGKRADEALAVVKANPGITIPEIAEKVGIKVNYLYRVMPSLLEDGKVTKQGNGYHAA